MVGIAAGKDLGLVLQPAEGARMDDAVAVALERVAVRMRRLRIAPSPGLLGLDRVTGEHERSLPQ